MFSILRKLSEEEKSALSKLEAFVLLKKKLKQIRNLLKRRKISIVEDKFDITIAESPTFPQIKADETVGINIDEINSDIRNKIKQEILKKFAQKAFEEISRCIAPNITGMDFIKQAVALQLFSVEPLHILLLGDPGTGKTAVLHSAAEISPISSFGLGSGTSGAGLVVTVKGNEVVKGLLPQADSGLCAIDELNLMKKEDYAGLYNAMEKGFVTYDKAGKHYKFNARVKVLATANPKGDSFKGTSIAELKRELPFDAALLTRFHLTFFVKKPDLKRFKEIASSILSGQRQIKLRSEDIGFIREYLRYVENIKEVNISEENQTHILSFVEELKKNERNYLVEINPRFVIGVMRLCKAIARMEARCEVEKKDIERVKEIVVSSLRLK